MAGPPGGRKEESEQLTRVDERVAKPGFVDIAG
jgi:hypothetical protein